MPKPSPVISNIRKSHGAIVSQLASPLKFKYDGLCRPNDLLQKWLLSHWGLHGNAILAKNFNNLAMHRSKIASHRGHKHGSKNQCLGLLNFLTSHFLLKTETSKINHSCKTWTKYLLPKWFYHINEWNWYAFPLPASSWPCKQAAIKGVKPFRIAWFLLAPTCQWCMAVTHGYVLVCH